MANEKLKSVAGWGGAALLLIAGSAAIGLSERASNANQMVTWPAIIGILITACVACGLLLWAYKPGDGSI